MLEFKELQVKAKELSQVASNEYKKFSAANGTPLACMSLFRLVVPASVEQVSSDIMALSSLAACLDAIKDEALKKYKQTQCHHNHELLKLDDFQNYKRDVLVGAYLLQWSKYEGLFKSVAHQVVISHFKKDLGINSIAEFDEAYVKSCFNALSDFCSFVYDNQSTDTDYSSLVSLLGNSVQSEIHEASCKTPSATSVLYGFVSAGIEALRR